MSAPIRRKSAKALKEGDQVVVTVARTLGVRGRKPTNGTAPLMEIEFTDGSRQTVRETDKVEVLSLKP